jgi:hypothetical protein
MASCQSSPQVLAAVMHVSLGIIWPDLIIWLPPTLVSLLGRQLWDQQVRRAPKKSRHFPGSGGAQATSKEKWEARQRPLASFCRIQSCPHVLHHTELPSLPEVCHENSVPCVYARILFCLDCFSLSTPLCLLQVQCDGYTYCCLPSVLPKLSSSRTLIALL